MAKQRFPRKLEIWVPDEMAEAFEWLAAQDPIDTVSDHCRKAFRLYLNQFGISPLSRPTQQAAE
jgi:hypothetical protein